MHTRVWEGCVLSITITTHVVVHTAHECLRRLHICAITLGSGNYNSAHQCLRTLGVCICGQWSQQLLITVVEELELTNGARQVILQTAVWMEQGACTASTWSTNQLSTPFVSPLYQSVCLFLSVRQSNRTNTKVHLRLRPTNQLST